ncbi:MAG: type II toxin-antitoxin system RelE/ParE family toxin [Candidatus Micrarchaeota archaeon]
MFQIVVVRKAVKFLRSLPKEYKEVVKRYLAKLTNELRPREAIRLKQMDECFRIRIGPFRVQYHIDEKAKNIIVYKISRRDETTYE